MRGVMQITSKCPGEWILNQEKSQTKFIRDSKAAAIIHKIFNAFRLKTCCPPLSEPQDVYKYEDVNISKIKNVDGNGYLNFTNLPLYILAVQSWGEIY